MNITPESKPISEIFPIEGQIKYKVPVYQRNYSWNTDNIDDLFNDISNEKRGYYIGNLLVSKVNGNPNNFDIVDGQQRLTTIALFFLSLFEILNDFISKASAEELEEIHAFRYDIKRKLLSSGKPRLELLNRDKEVIENYFGILDKKDKGKFGNRFIAIRYKYIQEIMIEELNNFNDIKNFYEKLNSVEFLRITVDDVSDAFSVFSSLNAKGLPLTLIDLMKSQYFSLAINNGMTEEDANDKWNGLINIFTDSSQEPNSFAITQFLLNNYDTFESNERSSITKRIALRKYKEIFDIKGSGYFEELIRNARIFSLISPLIENDNTYNITDYIHELLRNLMKLDSSQSYPLLMLLLKKNIDKKISDENVVKILELLRKFYVRRNIVLKPKASNIRFKIIEIIRKLNETEIVSENNINFALEIIKNIGPSDNEFLTALNEDVYVISSQTTRYILIEIERYYGSYFTKQNPDNLDNYKDSKIERKIPIWTLEHILPETNKLKYGWIEAISPSKPENAKELQQKFMHKLGNLTLTGYNSEMSDRSFFEKKEYKIFNTENYVGLRTKLFLNESIPDSSKNETIENKTSWSIDDIKRRTDYLSKLALEIFKL